MTHRHYICGTSTSDDMEIWAPNEEEAAMLYAKTALAAYPGCLASVWVGEVTVGEPLARTACTIMVPGACPFETEQFRNFVRWYVAVTGASGDLAWNKAVNRITRVDMGFEITPGVVPISLQDKETASGHMETFEWKLAGSARRG